MLSTFSLFCDLDLYFFIHTQSQGQSSDHTGPCHVAMGVANPPKMLQLPNECFTTLLKVQHMYVKLTRLHVVELDHFPIITLLLCELH